MLLFLLNGSHKSICQIVAFICHKLGCAFWQCVEFSSVIHNTWGHPASSLTRLITLDILLFSDIIVQILSIQKMTFQWKGSACTLLGGLVKIKRIFGNAYYFGIRGFTVIDGNADFVVGFQFHKVSYIKTWLRFWWQILYCPAVNLRYKRYVALLFIVCW